MRWSSWLGVGVGGGEERGPGLLGALEVILDDGDSDANTVRVGAALVTGAEMLLDARPILVGDGEGCGAEFVLGSVVMKYGLGLESLREFG